MIKHIKTIGIVTIQNYINYGNRLQNYALTKLLEAEGFRVLNGIRVNTKQGFIFHSRSLWRKIVKYLIPFPFLRDILTPRHNHYEGLLKVRENRFMEFEKIYTTCVPTIVARNYREAMKVLTQYGIDYFIAGSDQIWNPYYEGSNDKFLAFAPKSSRLSFAASIGTSTIPPSKVAIYQKYFKEMKYLSVREQRAVEIIRDLTGREADLTLDPTLILDTEQWLKAVKKPDIELPSDYICTYFLGEVPEAVEHFAREKQLQIYALNSETDSKLYTLDPGEFLYMIKNAAYVLTDSFHAVAFSIKFHKSFYVFERKEAGVESMFSRIETITKHFGLENRIQRRDCIEEQMELVDWDKIEHMLLEEKNKSLHRLLKAMEVE